MIYEDFFKGKKVTQLGLGLLGRGLNDAIFMLENGVADLIITDKKTAEELAPSVEKLKGYANLTLRLGEHSLSDFEDRDFILKAAGVPLDSPYIAHAKENGIPVEMDASLFCKLAPEVITIGITGTRGKSTTTMLIYELVKKAFGHATQRVFLAGNIRDTATLPLLKEAKKGDIVVLELDSWQLQGFGEAKISPHIAVFTNLMNDHLNYYDGNVEKYLDDKAQIFLHQKQNDYLVVGEKVSHLITAKYFGQTQHDPITASKETVPKDWDIKIRGEHNLENIACAIKVAKILNIPYETIKEAVESFKAPEGRLQLLKEVNGVKIYNDNNATTPEATVAALKALQENIVLVCGGADKNLELKELEETIKDTCKAVIVLPGSGSDRLNIEGVNVTNLKEAIAEAIKKCAPGDNLLFSPAFASFGLFTNEYDRNDQFLKIVEAL